MDVSATGNSASLNPSLRVRRLLAAAVASIGLSLGLDALVAALATAVVPATRGYSHFRFYDYGGLTAVGVLAACAAWPFAARTSAPRRVFFRLAVGVTAASWLADLYLLVVSHEPISAVGWLMLMHVGVAVATYNCIVRIAPAATFRDDTTATAAAAAAGGTTGAASLDRGRLDPARLGRVASTLAIIVALELAAGIAALVAVPAGRPSGVVPARGAVVYLVHALLGIPLAAGAAWLVVAARRLGDRHLRIAASAGAMGVALAGVGGMLTVSHQLRLLGMGLMLLGPVVAGFGYLVPSLDRLHEKELARQRAATAEVGSDAGTEATISPRVSSGSQSQGWPGPGSPAAPPADRSSGMPPGPGTTAS